MWGYSQPSRGQQGRPSILRPRVKGRGGTQSWGRHGSLSSGAELLPGVGGSAAVVAKKVAQEEVPHTLAPNLHITETQAPSSVHCGTRILSLGFITSYLNMIPTST